jgi:phosphoglucomutase
MIFPSREILIIDDSSIILDIAEMIFGYQKFKVTKAHNSIEAITLFESKNFDLIILDIALETPLAGIDLAKKFKSHHDPKKSNTHLIVVTGNTKVLNMDSFKECSVDFFVAKPIDYDKLTQHIRNVFENPQKISMEQAILDKANSWLKECYDPQTQQEVRRLIQEDPKELSNAFYKNLEFGTGGLRGVMGVGSNKMNRYTVGAASQGLAQYILQHNPENNASVVIAFDSRNSSPEFAQVAADVFSANGIKVYLFESLRPTPELSFAIRWLNCISGVVITASHNPKEYNGYKAYWKDGGQLVPPHDKNVIELVNAVGGAENINFNAKPELIHIIGKEIDFAYLNHLQKLCLNPEHIAQQHDLKIVYSPIHGTGITLVPQLLERLGFTHVILVEAQTTPDGNFPTVVYPNPEEKEAMSMGLQLAQEKDADVLLATDPDADRVGIAVKNHKGEFQLLNGNQTAALLFNYILSNRKAKGLAQPNDFIAKTIVTTDLIKQFCAAYQVKCFDVLTGFKYIAEAIRENEGRLNFVCGGEESYGYLIGDAVRDKDAVAAVGMICEMVAFYKSQNKTLFDALLDIYLEFGLYREELVSITRKGKEGAEEIAEMMRKFRENPPSSLAGSPVSKIEDYLQSICIDTQAVKQSPIDLPKSDVLQFYTENGDKISARPSGTEPKIKFYFSVKAHLNDKKDFDTAWQALKDRIEMICKDMKL